MDMTKKDLEESILAASVAKDFCERGKTDIVCPRCGSPVSHNGGFATFRVDCTNKKCDFHIVSRGI